MAGRGRQRHRRCYLHFANQMKGRRNCEGMLFRLAIYSVTAQEFGAKGWESKTFNRRQHCLELAGNVSISFLKFTQHVPARRQLGGPPIRVGWTNTEKMRESCS